MSRWKRCSHFRGVLGGCRGLGGADRGPRLQGGTAAQETIPIYRHHKTLRAGALARERGWSRPRGRQGIGGMPCPKPRPFSNLQSETPLQAIPTLCSICSGTPQRVGLVPLSSHIPLLPRHMHWTLVDLLGAAEETPTYLPAYLGLLPVREAPNSSEPGPGT